MYTFIRVGGLFYLFFIAFDIFYGIQALLPIFIFLTVSRFFLQSFFHFAGTYFCVSLLPSHPPTPPLPLLQSCMGCGERFILLTFPSSFRILLNILFLLPSLLHWLSFIFFQLMFYHVHTFKEKNICMNCDGENLTFILFPVLFGVCVCFFFFL